MSVDEVGQRRNRPAQSLSSSEAHTPVVSLCGITILICEIEGLLGAMADFSVNCSALFADEDVALRPRRARAAGFGAVEFYWPFRGALPTDAEFSTLLAAVDVADVSLTAIDLTTRTAARSLWEDPSLCRLYRASCDIAFGIGSALGTTTFTAAYRFHDETHVGDTLSVVAANIGYAAQVMAHINADIVVDPLDGAQSWDATMSAIALVDRVRAEFDVDNVLVSANVDHRAVSCEDVVNLVAARADRVGHVRITRMPELPALGCNIPDVARFAARLAQSGYEGQIALAYKGQVGDPFWWIPRSQRA
ncbi:TIM barrel protein [Mycobacterium sp. 236(2023)]|uniref:TIM barrel protein n=1 Tax=Mycobacterium sp. 236(2023) TaxID=3038163 RepID=UPI0024156BFB|nr:TIM barrel protein [Mycobacterium sp. 236(2023)]MDG4667887.1 TIM barrel protein [Mycobacterium sp. 236(2023)]